MISAGRWWTRFWAERSSSSSFPRLAGEVMELLEAGGRAEEKGGSPPPRAGVEHQWGPRALQSTRAHSSMTVMERQPPD